MKNIKNDKTGSKGFVYVAVGVTAVGGLLFGYDTGVNSGAILFIQKQYALSTIMEEVVVSSCFGRSSHWLLFWVMRSRTATGDAK